MIAMLMLALMIPYFIPAIISIVRKKDNKVAICALNLFLGWTLVGWVVALVWSLSKDKQPQTIIINNSNNPGVPGANQ